MVSNRRALPPGETPERPPAEDAGAADVAEEPSLTEPSPAAPVAPAPVLDVPEPPASRLARLRRRLSGSNNPLARGLLSLLAGRPDRRRHLGRPGSDPDHLGPGSRSHHRADRCSAARPRHRRRQRSRQGPPGAQDGTGQAGRAGHGPHPPGDRVPTASPGSSWWSASTAPARRRPSASWPACWSPRATRVRARRRRHLPRRGRRPAPDLGCTGSASTTVRGDREGADPASRGVRGGRARESPSGVDVGDGRHRRTAAHQDRPDGRVGQDQAGHREEGPGHRGAARASTPPPARTGSPRPASSPRWSTSPASS